MVAVSTCWSDPSENERGWKYYKLAAEYLKVPFVVSNHPTDAPDAGVLRGDGTAQSRHAKTETAIVYGCIQRSAGAPAKNPGVPAKNH